jgi:hypothetical protein
MPDPVTDPGSGRATRRDVRRTPYIPGDAAAREVSVQLRVQAVRAAHPDLTETELAELTRTIATQVDDAEVLHTYELGTDDEPYFVVPCATRVPPA